MSLVIKNENGSKALFITDPSRRDDAVFYGSKPIPQQIQHGPLDAKIDILEEPNYFVVSSELPGVAVMDLWVVIEGMMLSLYAGVTGEKQKNGEYRYTEELIGGIRGWTMLSMRAQPEPIIAEFDKNVLRLVFPKKVGELSKK
jgi:HSP20 family molecular chaperone IbpA